MLWKCCTQYASKFGKLNSGHRTGKGQLSFQSQKKVNAKECSNYHKIALISHDSTVMFKILQASLQQYINWELPDIKAQFREGRETRDQTASICCTIEKAREFQKNFYFIDYAKAFDCVGHNKLWTVLKEMGIPDHLTCLLEICIQVKKQQLELEMKQWTGSKLGKEYVKAVYCHPAYLTYMHSTSCEMPGWMKHKLESRLPGEISVISDMQMTPPLWQKVKKN